jgi:hypothetical protein
VRRSHAAFIVPERMLDCLSTLAQGFWVCIKAPLHRFEQMLMLPPWNPAFSPCPARGLERTILTGRSPVAPYPFASDTAMDLRLFTMMLHEVEKRAIVRMDETTS